MQVAVTPEDDFQSKTFEFFNQYNILAFFLLSHFAFLSDFNDKIIFIFTYYNYNFPTGKEDQFMKHSHDLVLKVGMKYDYLSIMHYGQSTFGKLTVDKKHYMRTIETIDKTYQNLIGQRKAPSKADIEAANLLYGCPGQKKIITLILFSE